MPLLESMEREEEGNANGNANVQEAPPPINVGGDVDEEFPNELSMPPLEPMTRPFLCWRITLSGPASFLAVAATTQAKIIRW